MVTVRGSAVDQLGKLYLGAAHTKTRNDVKHAPASVGRGETTLPSSEAGREQEREKQRRIEEHAERADRFPSHKRQERTSIEVPGRLLSRQNGHPLRSERDRQPVQVHMYFGKGRHLRDDDMIERFGPQTSQRPWPDPE